MGRKYQIYTHELRLLFVSDLPNGSILKMLSLNRIQLEDLNLCKKIHNYGAVELTVHISKCCVCFLFTPLCLVHMNIYHVHLKIKMCKKAKSSSNAKRENTFLLLSPFSRELLTDISQAEGNQTSLCKKSYMEFLEQLQSKTCPI